MEPRLRESRLLSLTVCGGELTQPRAHLLADPCSLGLLVARLSHLFPSISLKFLEEMTEHVVLAEEAPPKSRENHPGGRIVPAALSYQSPEKELRRGRRSHESAAALHLRDLLSSLPWTALVQKV